MQSNFFKNKKFIFGNDSSLTLLIILILALGLVIARPFLPDSLIRIPDWAILTWDVWLSSFFNFVKDGLGLLYFTRTLTSAWNGY